MTIADVYEANRFLPLIGEWQDDEAEAIVKARMHFAGNPIWNELTPAFWLDHFLNKSVGHLRIDCLNLGIDFKLRDTRAVLAGKLTEYFVNLTGGTK